MRLKDVVIIQGGYAFKSSDFSDSGIPIIRIGNISGEIVNIDKDVCYPEKFWDDHPEFRIENGDILVAMSGATVGKVGLFAYSGKALLNQRVCNIKPDEKKIRKKFLYFYCMSHAFKENIQKNAFGCAQPNISAKQIGEFEIDVPTLTEQDYYSEILSKVKNVIDLYGLELKYLEGLIKSRFVEMFGDEKNCMLMSDLCSIITDGTHQPPKFVPKGIPFIFVSNIAGDKVTYEAEKFISEETYNELIKRTPVEIGDMLLSTVGSYGHPAVVKTDKKFLFQRHIAYLKPKRDIVDSDYLHGALLSPDLQRQIEAGVKGIAQKTLNLSEIKKMTIPVPEINRQKEFAAFVHQVDKLKSATQKSLDETQQLFDSLMQKYFG